MRMCQVHWDMLRTEVNDQGLGGWIAQSGALAAEQLVDQLKRREDTKVNYDPLMSSFFMIMHRTMELVGLLGMAPDFGCPICFLNSARKPDGSCGCDRPECEAKEPGSIPDHETWLVGPNSCVTAAKGYMRDQGWIE